MHDVNSQFLPSSLSRAAMARIIWQQDSPHLLWLHHSWKTQHQQLFLLHWPALFQWWWLWSACQAEEGVTRILPLQPRQHHFGLISMANIAYQKMVAIRVTHNQWETFWRRTCQVILQWYWDGEGSFHFHSAYWDNLGVCHLLCRGREAVLGQ